MSAGEGAADDSREAILERIRSRRESIRRTSPTPQGATPTSSSAKLRPGNASFNNSSFTNDVNPTLRVVTPKRDAKVIDTSRPDAAGPNEASFQALTEGALSAIEVQSNASFNDTFNSKLISGNPSFRTPSIMDMPGKYQKAKDRVELLTLQLWQRDSRDGIIDEESDARQQILCAAHRAAISRVIKVKSELDRCILEVENIQESHRNPSKRLLELLEPGSQSSPELRHAYSEGIVASAGDVSIDEETACMMVDSYARHRDKEKKELLAQVDHLTAENQRLRQQTEQQSRQLAKVEEAFEIETQKRIEDQSARQHAWAKLREELVDTEMHKAKLIRDITAYESQLTDLRTLVDESNKREREILQACKEGESQALSYLSKRHEDDLKALRDDLATMKAKKDFYKEKYTHLRVIKDECLRGRAMIQAEVMELQEARRAIHAQCEAAVAEARQEQAKVALKGARDRKALMKLRSAVRQRDEADGLGEELEISLNLNRSVPMSGSRRQE